jgi:hypothetical protein
MKSMVNSQIFARMRVMQRSPWDNARHINVGEVNVSLSRLQTFLLSVMKSPETKRALREFYWIVPLRSPNDKSRYFRSPEQRNQLVKSHYHHIEEFSKCVDIDDIEAFFDLNNFNHDEHWTEFVPPWKYLAHYLAEFAEHMAKAKAAAT